jgi:putative PIN family toxin of toxin-antitoxin system
MFLADIVESDAETEVSLRDAADQQLLGTLRSSRANYLITGDKDLLAVAEKYPIVTPAVFWARHG